MCSPQTCAIKIWSRKWNPHSTVHLSQSLHLATAASCPSKELDIKGCTALDKSSFSSQLLASSRSGARADWVANGDQPLVARRARWSTLIFFGGGARNASVVHDSPALNGRMDRWPLTGEPKARIGSGGSAPGNPNASSGCGGSASAHPSAESAWEADPLRNWIRAPGTSGRRYMTPNATVKKPSIPLNTFMALTASLQELVCERKSPTN